MSAEKAGGIRRMVSEAAITAPFGKITAASAGLGLKFNDADSATVVMLTVDTK